MGTRQYQSCGCRSLDPSLKRFDHLSPANPHFRERQVGIMDNKSRYIELNGEYDLADREKLATLFGALPADGPATIDLTKVTYLDSTVLNALAKLRVRFKENTIKLLVGSENIKRIFRIVQFDNLFEVVEM
jgi:anti-anti-sigma factor